MSERGRGLTKWQLALLVGVGATAGLGASLLAYIVYKRSRSKPSQTPRATPVEFSPEHGANDKGATTVTGGDKNRATGGTEQKPKVSEVCSLCVL